MKLQAFQSIYDERELLKHPGADLILESRMWHKFVVVPSDYGDAFAPARYAVDLARNNLFRLPYPNVAVQMGPFHYDDKDVLDLDWIHRAGPSTEFVVLARQNSEGIEGRIWQVHDRAMTLSHGYVRIPNDALGVEQIGEDWASELCVFDGPISAEDKGLRCVETVMFRLVLQQFVGTLNAKGAHLEVQPEPKFINQKRVAKGKSPLFGYHLLEVRPGAAIPGSRSIGDGNRASPRMHWRRGHIRTLGTGRLINIPPCLVGSPSSGVVDKDYIVQRAA